jgi:WD40 repeat protein
MRLDDGQVIASFAQCTWPIEAGAFSPDGKFLAVGGYAFGEQACRSCAPRQALAVWRVADGVRVVEQLWAPDGEVSALAFSPDGQYLAAAGSERQQGKDLATEVIKIFRVADWQLLRAIQLPKGPYERPIRTLAFSPDGKFLAAAGEERAIRLWRVQNGKLVRLLPGHYEAQNKGDYVRSLAFSRDGVWLASAASDEVVKIWRVADGSLIKELPGAGSIVSFSRDGRYFLSANAFDRDPGVRLWGVGQWALLGELSGVHRPPRIHDVAVNWEKGLVICLEGDAVSAWRFTHEGFQLLQRRFWFTLSLWNGFSSWLWFYRCPGPGPVAFSPDGQLLVTPAAEGSVLWKADGTFLRMLDRTGAFFWFAFPTKERLVAFRWSFEKGEEIQVWDWAKGKVVATIPPPCRGPIAAASGGSVLVACEEANAVEVRNLENSSLVKRMPLTGKNGHSDQVSDYCLSPDGKWLVGRAPDGFFKFWRTADGQLIQSLRKVEARRVNLLFFSPNSKLLGVEEVHRDEGVRSLIKVLELEKQRLVGTIVPNELCLYFTFSPNGKLLTCWGPDAHPSVYRVADGALSCAVPEQAESVAFSPDGLFLAVLGRESLSLWRLPRMN